MKQLDVIIIGAGAAGLMCAIEAGKRGRRVLVLDHANKVGKKILMSGGGRCNFTNYSASPNQYISHNPHFCKSALSRFTQWDFIELVKKHEIPFHEKTLGQLFCDRKSRDIVDMLVDECHAVGAKIQLKTDIIEVKKQDNREYFIRTSKGLYQCESIVIATGGLSIPTMGASPFAYKIAEQFGIHVWPTRAALVPFTLDVTDKERFSALSGISVDSLVETNHIQFRENILFTHRGLSGPAVLQASSYWNPGDMVHINLLPEQDLLTALQTARAQKNSKQVGSFLAQYLPKRVVDVFIPSALSERKLTDCSNKHMHLIAENLTNWLVKPNGTEGYRTAEVTLGGVDCDAISSKTMQANLHPGLYFIGESLDVTGWLGGYNFQWAWSSGWAAGQVA